MLCRVAASHLRVGTFQFAAASGDRDLLRALADHAIARHHPEAADAARPYLELYRRVVEAQAELVARWMLVGFIHGVMNTDNTTISGETIDYGPCAFLDAFDPATVFSSIDHRGRYAYGNQPAIAQWNLARLAETLLPLIDEDADAAVAAATAVLAGSPRPTSGTRPRAWRRSSGSPAPDRELGTDLLELLRAQRVDFTLFFRALAAGTARSLFAEPEPFDAWAARREALLPADRAGVAAAMNRVNPAYIPRNHRVEEALTAATAGELDRSAGCWTPCPGRTRSVPAWRTSPGRRPRAAPRTSPTAEPEALRRSRAVRAAGRPGHRVGPARVRDAADRVAGGRDGGGELARRAQERAVVGVDLDRRVVGQRPGQLVLPARGHHPVAHRHHRRRGHVDLRDPVVRAERGADLDRDQRVEQRHPAHPGQRPGAGLRVEVVVEQGGAEGVGAERVERGGPGSGGDGPGQHQRDRALPR